MQNNNPLKIATTVVTTNTKHDITCYEDKITYITTKRDTTTKAELKHFEHLREKEREGKAKANKWDEERQGPTIHKPHKHRG